MLYTYYEDKKFEKIKFSNCVLSQLNAVPSDIVINKIIS